MPGSMTQLAVVAAQLAKSRGTNLVTRTHQSFVALVDTGIFDRNQSLAKRLGKNHNKTCSGGSRMKTVVRCIVISKLMLDLVKKR
jgi:hypothetical protein